MQKSLAETHPSLKECVTSDPKPYNGIPACAEGCCHRSLLFVDEFDIQEHTLDKKVVRGAIARCLNQVPKHKRGEFDLFVLLLTTELGLDGE